MPQLKNEHFPLLLLHNRRRQIIVCIIYDVIIAIIKNYLPYSTSSKKSLICEVLANNYVMLLKLYVKGRCTLPEIINFFCNLFQFAKINVTNFDQS